MIRNNLMPKSELKKIRPVGFTLRITAIVLAVLTLWLGVSMYMVNVTKKHYEEELKYIEQLWTQIPDNAGRLQELQNNTKLLEQQIADLLGVLEMPGMIQARHVHRTLLDFESVASHKLWVLDWGLNSYQRVSITGVAADVDALQGFMVRLQEMESTTEVLLTDMQFVDTLGSRFVYFDLFVSY